MSDKPKKKRAPKPFAEDRSTAMAGDVFLSDLPERVRQAIKDAFNDCGAMDLYGGRAVEYINVVASQMRDARLRNEVLIARIRAGVMALTDNELTVEDER